MTDPDEVVVMRDRARDSSDPVAAAVWGVGAEIVNQLMWIHDALKQIEMDLRP